MDSYKCMKIPISLFLEHIIQQYYFRSKVNNGFIYLEIRRRIYGLPQADMLANKYLKYKLAPHGYYEVPHTPGLWKHISYPVQFSLVVNNLASSMSERNMSTTSSVPSRENLPSANIGKEPCIMSFHSNGIMKKVGYNLAFQDTSKRYYKNKIKPEPPKPQHAPYPC